MTPNRIAFKANEEDSNSKASVSHAGLKTGAVWAGIGTIGSGTLYSYASKIGELNKGLAEEFKGNPEFGKFAQEALENAKACKVTGKAGLYSIPMHVALALGCGALVDKLNNDKRAEFAEKLAANGKEEALKNDDNAEITKNGNVYCKSNMGKKLGALLGLVAAPLPDLILSPMTKNIEGPKSWSGFKGYAKIGVIGAIGGLILGAIADKYSNKTAAKQADKQAIAEG